MKFFIDTADINEIREGNARGWVDGVTTNPTLVAKTGKSNAYCIAEICREVKGPVSAEVISLQANKMYEEGKSLAKIADNVVVKIPMCEEGLIAVRRFAAEGIKTNVETTSANSFDILEFEFRLDNAQYSKYTAKGNLIDSIKAKRIDFENNYFIYSTESHKFLDITELIEKKDVKANLHKRRIEALKTGDVIALINTERDILVELVEKNTNTKELASVKEWTGRWKNLLKEYYSSIGNDFERIKISIDN